MTGQKASIRLIEKIKEFEGYRSEAYKCPAGKYTIGYGHTRGVSKDTPPCTTQQADVWLRQDLAEAEGAVASLSVTERQHRFDALVSLCYNIGPQALRSSTLLRLIRSCADSAQIRSEWLRWCHSGTRKLAGLLERRKWEAELFINAKY